MTGVGVSSEGEFGANEWLVDEMYEQFKLDRNSVDKSWWPILEAYHPVDEATAPAAAPAAAPPAAPAAAPAAPAAPEAAASDRHPVTAPIPVIGAQPVARTTTRPAASQPIPAQAPKSQPSSSEAEAEADVVTTLRGMPKTLAANMDESLTVPTAPSVRTVPMPRLMKGQGCIIGAGALEYPAEFQGCLL